MVGLSGLWMPIVLSAVAVFIASSLVHMVLGWHAGDYVAPPRQDELADAMRPFNLQPGEYMMPRPASMKDMRTPEFIEKHRKGPVVMMTVFPGGKLGMGKQLGLWFVYTLGISFFVAYVTGRTNGQAADYLAVFRVAGSVAFAAYALGGWQAWIWYNKATRSTVLATIDGLIYALLTAGVFGWLWPR